MSRIFKHRPSPALVVALLALFVALGGGALAASSFLGSNGQIHACVDSQGHLTLVKPGKKCETGKHKISWNQTGPRGPRGPSDAYVTRSDNAVSLGSDHGYPAAIDTTVATLSLPAGRYELLATGVLRSTSSDSPQVKCLLTPTGATGAKHEGASSSSLGAAGGTGDVATTALTAYASSTHTLGVTLHCHSTNLVPNGAATIENAVVSATSVGSLHLQ